MLCHVADTLLTEILSANMKVSLKTILCKFIILGGSPAPGRIFFFVTSFHMTSHITNNGALSLSLVYNTCVSIRTRNILHYCNWFFSLFDINIGGMTLHVSETVEIRFKNVQI